MEEEKNEKEPKLDEMKDATKDARKLLNETQNKNAEAKGKFYEKLQIVIEGIKNYTKNYIKNNRDKLIKAGVILSALGVLVKSVASYEIDLNQAELSNTSAENKTSISILEELNETNVEEIFTTPDDSTTDKTTDDFEPITDDELEEYQDDNNKIPSETEGKKPGDKPITAVIDGHEIELER